MSSQTGLEITGRETIRTAYESIDVTPRKDYNAPYRRVHMDGFTTGLMPNWMVALMALSVLLITLDLLKELVLWVKRD